MRLLDRMAGWFVRLELLWPETRDDLLEDSSKTNGEDG